MPDRGDVLMQGHTPLVVVSGRRFNGRVGMLVCWPVTMESTQASNPFAVGIGSKSHGYGYVMCHLPRTIDWRASDVHRHPWRQIGKAVLEAAMFKLDEVITED